VYTIDLNTRQNDQVRPMRVIFNALASLFDLSLEIIRLLIFAFPA